MPAALARGGARRRRRRPSRARAHAARAPHIPVGRALPLADGRSAGARRRRDFASRPRAPRAARRAARCAVRMKFLGKVCVRGEHRPRPLARKAGQPRRARATPAARATAARRRVVLAAGVGVAPHDS